MDSAGTDLARELLADTGWVERTRGFARSLRRSTDPGDGLLLVGTRTQEPWHLAAHLDDEARCCGIPTLSPTLVRWAPPTGAPAHLAISLERLEHTRRGETVVVVAPDDPGEQLLERLADARRTGITLLTLDDGDPEWDDLAHERLVVPAAGTAVVPAVPLSLGRGGLGLDVVPAVSFDTVQHLVSAAAGESPLVLTGRASRRGFRDRLGRLLDTLQGPTIPD